MVCVNNLLHNSSSAIGRVKFNTSHNFSSVYNSLADKSCDAFVSTEKIAKLKSNPILDAVKQSISLIKEPRVKIAESLHDMILDLSKGASDAFGKDAIVYSIPDHPDLVLRVEKTAMEKLGGLSNDLELVPIKYGKDIEANKHLGIPMYFVTSKHSGIARKSSISPLEAVAQKDKIMVLRKVTGEHPSKDCGEELLSLMGFDDFKNPDADALNNFSFVFGYVQRNFGAKAAAKCLEAFKSGAKEIPANALGEGSAPFEIVKGQEFYKKYQTYADSYVKSLSDISEIPQKSYDDAVNFIVSPKNFHLDFQHTNNTFVDLEKREFNFMDFAYDKTDEKYIYENPIKEFRNVLFGKGCKQIGVLKDAVPFLPVFKYPRDIIVTPDYVEKVKTYSKAIHDKINLAAPEKFKSEKVFER